MQQLVEWLEERVAKEHANYDKALEQGLSHLRVYAGASADTYLKTLDYIRTEFLGEATE